MSDQPPVNQTAFQNMTVGGDVTANVDQSVNKTVIHQAPRQNQPIPSNVRQGSKNYVAREDDPLLEIHTKLQVGQGVIVCAVEGMGGVGKTELALQYAERFKHEYVGRYWLSLREMGLAQAVVILAIAYIDLPEPMQLKSLEEQAEWYWKNWLPESGKLLVILDDVPNAESLPDLAMPLDPRVQILVTTRERDLNLGFESLSVKVLSEEKALELLGKIVGVAKVEQELETVKEICKTLGYLPLGLELVGEYLVKNRHLNFAKLQERLSLADESLSRDRSNKFYGYRGVVAAMQLSWDDLSLGSQRVAMWLGLFAPVEILWELVADLGKNVELTEAELDGARGELDRLHLIAPTDEGCDFYTIHALVREFMRVKLSEATENQQFRQGFVMGLLRMAKQMPQSPTLEKIAEMTPVIPHLDLLSREMLDDIPPTSGEDSTLLWIFEGIANFYEGKGFYEQATIMYLQCLQESETRFNTENLVVASSLHNLGSIYLKQGKYGDSETYYTRALRIRQNVLQYNHADIALSLNDLAILKKHQGDYSASIDLYSQSLKMRILIYGELSYEVAESLNNFGLLYNEQGRYKEAELFLQKSLDIRMKLSEKEDQEIALNLNSLASSYHSQNKYEDAINIYIKALDMTKKIFGSKHRDVATILSNLGESFACQKKYHDAEAFLLEALEIRQEILGLDHPELAHTLHNLGALNVDLGKFSEAEELYKRALLIRRKVFGENHMYIANSYNSLGKCYYFQQNYQDAENLYIKALNILKKNFDPQHPHINIVRENLEKVREKLGYTQLKSSNI
jgi:tetratricopeptide (TPR) repeat protein